MRKLGSRLLGMILSGSMILTMPSAAYAAKKADTVKAEIHTVSDTSGQWNNEELYDKYVESLFFEHPKGINRLALSGAKTTLNENEKWLYNELKEPIKKIAAGERISTEIQITIPDNDTRFTWPTVSDDNPTRKFKGFVDVVKVWYCLLSDMPYELYWHDKSVDKALKCQCSSKSLNSTTKKIDTITVSLAVNVKYAAQGESYKTNLDTSDNLQRARKAADNAKKIVEENKGKSDYEKLKSYMTKICDLNTYNSSAMKNMDTTDMNEGIDPWQLVYVFDEDTGTNVVCEGYSKAFAYLCELTDFQSSQIACYIVSGTLSGGTGAGGHMWNIVTMDDGNNYLVDITNCDDGAIGAPYNLFLAALPGSAANGYTYTKDAWNQAAFQYDTETKELYGTGAGSILTLKNTNNYMVYSPSGTVGDKDLSKASVSLSASSFTYTGNTQMPNVTLTLDGQVLDTSAYSVSIISTDSTTGSAGKNAGTVTLQIAAKTNSGYTGSLTKTYQITPAETKITLSNLTQTEGSTSSVTASLNPYSADAKASVEYCVEKNGREEWTTTVPATAGTYKVRAYLSDKNAGKNLIGYKDYATAASAGKAATGTLTVNKKSAGDKTVSTNSDGSTTTTIKSVEGTTKITVTVEKDRSGKVTSSKAVVEVTEKNDEAVLTGTDIQKIGKNVEGAETKITLTVCDPYGKQLYTIKADSGDLYVGHRLYIVKESGDQKTYTLVNDQTYIVSPTGSISLNMTDKADYVLVDEKEVRQLEQKVKASIQLKKSTVKIKKGKTCKVVLNSTLDKTNVKKISYSTTNKKVLKVSKNGTVRAKKKGTAYVKVKVVLKNGSAKTVKMKVTVR